MGDGGEGLGNTARLIKLGGREKQGSRGRGNTLLSNSPSSFFRVKNYFFLLSNKLSLTLCVCHYINGIFKSLCPCTFSRYLLLAMFVFRK